MASGAEVEDMEVKKTRVLVTGGAGFIGSHVVELLLSLRADVLVVDTRFQKKSYFATANLKKSVKISRTDIADKKKIAAIFLRFKPQYVLHLAAEPIVDNAYSDPFNTFQTNVMGTVCVLEAARKVKSLKGIIVASSDKAYGKTQKAYTEESPLKGDHPYDASKSCADLIAQAYGKTYNMPIAITRFGNVYGEGDLHLSRIIPGICEALLKNKELIIRSNGKYVRDYIYVKDVAEGYLQLLQRFEEAAGNAYNFSSNDTLSVLELIRIVEKTTKTKIRYSIANTAKNEIPYQHLNDQKVRKLGWKPKRTLIQTIDRIIDWYATIL